MDDTRIDERGLTEVENQAVPIFQSAPDLLAKCGGAAEVEVSLKADGDDLVGLGDNVNESGTLLGAKG